VLKRAGLWNPSGYNNVLVQCDQGYQTFNDYGSHATTAAQNWASGKTNCVFTVAPSYLPIFINPFKAMSGQTNPNVGLQTNATGFNYDLFKQAWTLSSFGQPDVPPPGTVITVNRYGLNNNVFEGALDVSIADKINDYHRPLVAVAPGVIRGVQNRYICQPGNCLGGMPPGTDHQAELFIEHQVGPNTSLYHENFISQYHHMVDATNGNINVKGNTVNAGDVIGYVGHTYQGTGDPHQTDANNGNSSGDHLDFSVARTTNLSSYRSYSFSANPGNSTSPPNCRSSPPCPTNAPACWDSSKPENCYGYNGFQGEIDPFGWDAPAGVDPYASAFLSYTDPNWPSFPGPGAFSMYLWEGNPYTPGTMPPYQQNCVTNADCTSPLICGGGGWPGICGNACQTLSNMFGVHPGDWAFSGGPDSAEGQYWINNNCSTSPVITDGSVDPEASNAATLAACEYAAGRFAIWAGHTFNFAPSNVQAWWSDPNHSCNASYDMSTYPDPCQITANDYAIVAGHDWGYTPTDVRTWWTSNNCNVSYQGDACQVAANQFGIVMQVVFGRAIGSWGFAPSDVQTWWTSNCMTHSYAAQPWGVYNGLPGKGAPLGFIR
jgi:hypothetical protein